MCGIVGYVGHREAVDVLVHGLHRLEYRGYDSAGVAVIDPEGRIQVVKTAGRIADLERLLAKQPLQGRIGIGHTRWATHGVPNQINAHPHLGADGLVAVVHNGVIENYETLRSRLEAEGYRFQSATDTEAIAHLVAECLRTATGPGGQRPSVEVLIRAVQAALAQLQGTYGLAMLFRDWPNLILAARRGSPLIVGVGNKEHFISSDATSLVGYTDKIITLADHELAVLTADSLRVIHRDHGHRSPTVQVLDWTVAEVSRGGYPHYMLKEIFEQPEAIRNTMRGRLDWDEATARFGGLNLSPQELRRVRRILFTGCGTSWHAGLVGEYLIETLARLPVEVEYASELRYRNPPLENDTLVFVITQSGETADTLAALREMKRKGLPTLAICNVVGSSIATEADGGIYLHAGPEIGVASTKAYTCQCTVLVLLALYFGRLRHLGFDDGRRILEHLQQLPDHLTEALQTWEQVRDIAEKYAHCEHFLYLGRHFNFPTALEGALKMKEISYIHAEGYPAAEMKHGPIALVDERTPSVFLMPQGPVYDKVLANMQEIKARGGPVIAIVCRGDHKAGQLADQIIEIPPVPEFLQPIVSVVPLQLLAYYTAVARGCDVDKPRNLAKSVTVE
jgi:glucosamine--fructose-6-phosphate aminotransferase (isomerizing)